MSTRRKHLGCAVFNNYIYAVGGRDDCMELSSAERQSTDQYLEPHRGHDLPPQWGEFLLHFFSANSIVLNEIAPF